MKLKTICTSLAALSCCFLALSPIRADESLDDLFFQSNEEEVDEFLEASGLAIEIEEEDLEGSLHELMEELEDLDVATDRRRAVLQKKIAERVAKQAARKARNHPRIQWLQKGDGAMPVFGSVKTDESWYLGVFIREEKEGEGVLIQKVIEDSPAAEAGLKKGERLLTCNGIRIRSQRALVQLIGAAGDQELEFEVANAESDGLDDFGDDPEMRKVRLTPAKKEIEKEVVQTWSDPASTLLKLGEYDEALKLGITGSWHDRVRQKDLMEMLRGETPIGWGGKEADELREEVKALREDMKALKESLEEKKEPGL
ncbi:MAG: PDZ domain-containing protein [Verrucomicrobiota bacterium]